MTNDQVQSYIAHIPSALEHEVMSKHTSYHAGGAARLYVAANSSAELWLAVHTALELNLPWYVFGGGTNLLVADTGFEGVMIQAANRGVEIQETTVKLESGMITVSAARKIVDAGLTGFEWAVGLPGTIGGAVYGDAGCYGGEMRQVIASVDAYRMKDRERVTLSNQDCQFDYRESLFKHEPHLILGCQLELKKALDPVASRARLNEILAERKADQPLGSLSAGCIFKNPKVTQEQVDYLVQRGYMPKFGHDSRAHISAGWLVETAGMMSERVGEVEVSDKHGNFFLSKPGVRTQDIIALISLVKMKVRDDLGIELQEEVQYVGF